MRRNRRALEGLTTVRGMLVMVAAVCVLPVWGQDTQPGSGFDGHVYLAQLVTKHPLYPDLVRLERAIQALQAPEPQMVLDTFSVRTRIGGEYIAGPVIARWPMDRLSQMRDRVALGLTDLPEPAISALPDDLASELQWRRTQVQRAGRLELLRAQAESSRQLAEASTRLYRENQERLTSLGEKLEGPGESPDEVRAELEARLDEMREEHRGRLARLERSIAERTQATISQAERSAWRRTGARLRRPSGGISESLRQGMVDTLRGFEFPDWLGDVSLTIPGAGSPEGQQVVGDTGAVDAARQETRKRFAAELVRRRSVIEGSLHAATRMAVVRISRKHGVRLQLSPIGEAVGPDMTEEIGKSLSELWAAGSR